MNLNHMEFHQGECIIMGKLRKCQPLPTVILMEQESKKKMWRVSNLKISCMNVV